MGKYSLPPFLRSEKPHQCQHKILLLGHSGGSTPSSSRLGKLSSTVLHWFQDVNDIREVPDHQVFVQSVVLQALGLMYNSASAVVTTAVGPITTIEANLLILVFFKCVDFCSWNHGNRNCQTIAVPTAQAGCMSLSEAFGLAVTCF
ncbi:hypothetical protein L6164_027113 [Bauhinia variegata]|uniref:Uncharacterized protein n=1 Tax=Bauhinia variegata TaxID=167791 RepID=A0ACB9LSW9_BAUVA|nr:hypothetical protein L6164_027113 [Bauhinia variegata]